MLATGRWCLLSTLSDLCGSVVDEIGLIGAVGVSFVLWMFVVVSPVIIFFGRCYIVVM